jgi:NAD-dependent SIR2 family protein deacetylase
MSKWSHMDGSQSGAVNPKTDCPHIPQCFAPGSAAASGRPLQINLQGKCNSCESANENWLCLVCLNIGCSRFVHGHGVEHFERTQHAVALSFADYMTWCYECDEYVTSKTIEAVADVVQKLRNEAQEASEDSKSGEDERVAKMKEFVENAVQHDWSSVDPSSTGPVNPKLDCPHVGASFTPLKNPEGKEERDLVNVEQPCGKCGDVAENWLCLTCYSVNCSRFVNGDAAKHFESTFHPIALSFSDFSIWCYCCDSYIKNDCFFEVQDLAHLNKHGVRAKDAKKPGKLTGHVKEEDVKEFFDEPEVLAQKVKQLAEWMRTMNYTVVYTGAGISTSAKLPDYRGPQGVWTLREKGLTPKMDVTIDQALPTPTHMALVQLEKEGVIKFVVSTNVDGLHRRSGLPADKLSELHGNSYLEICTKCGKEYLRSQTVGSGRRDHLTGRRCDDESCRGNLRDSIINFEEKLPEHELEKTYMEAKKSDLAIVLGSSMRVQPANLFPSFATENGGKLVIVNLQKTLYHNRASLVIHGRMDEVIQMLMNELDVDIPRYDEEHDVVKKRN